MRLQFLSCLVLAVAQMFICFAEPHVQPVEPANSSHAGFKLMECQDIGITFTNRLNPARASENQILLNGSGVAAGDVDGDGNCDLYFCSLDGENILYRNLGNWRFVDVTTKAGLSNFGFPCTGPVFADLDGDGDLDLLVNSV